MADTTKTLREAADAALAVLVTASSFLSKKARDRAPKVIADLRAALAAQAQAETVAQANRIYAADMTCSSCRNEGSDACMSCDALSADLPPRMYQAKLATDAPQPAAQPVADELRIARGAIRELEAKVFSQEQALAVLRASVDSYHRDMADPPGYLQDAVIRAAGLGAMAEQIAALKKAQPVRQPLTDERITQCWGESQGTRNGYVPFARAVERAHGIGQEGGAV